MEIQAFKRTMAIQAFNTSIRAKSLAVFQHGAREVRVHLSRCVVMSPPGGYCEALINPANERLVGTKLPYFPKGGPTPEDTVYGAAAVQRDWAPPGFVSQWGGMEIGGQMLYPISVVDGMVSMLGGKELRRECAKLAVLGPAGSDVRCPIGSAVRTGAPGGLGALFGAIVHAVPPFFARTDADEPAPEWRTELRRCWLRALAVAEPSASIAAPLLGAGARGAPTEEAARVAAGATAEWLWSVSGAEAHAARVLHLTVQSEDVAALLARELEIATETLAASASAARDGRAVRSERLISPSSEMSARVGAGSELPPRRDLESTGPGG